MLVETIDLVETMIVWARYLNGLPSGRAFPWIVDEIFSMNYGMRICADYSGAAGTIQSNRNMP